MGRIDEALRRAADTDSAKVPAPTPPDNAAGDVFSSPWTFPEEGDADAAAEARDVSPFAAPASGVVRSAPGGPGRMAVFRGFDKNVIGRIVAAPGASPMLAEQFRRLAATLHHAQLVQGTKVIMITSASPGDGKSLTAANLALTLSESYRRQVLLIDADLRRPSLHEIFNSPNVGGLNDGLKAKRDGKLAVLQITDTLTLLPAGRPDPDPMSTLTSPRMREILQESAARFDWVVVDTPPLGLLTDASLLSTMVDGVLVVIRANQTPFAAASKTIESIGRDRVLGVVLNAVEQGVTKSGDYNRYYGATDAAPAPAVED